MWGLWMLSTRSVWDSCLESDGTTDSEMMKYFSGAVWLHCPISSRRRISVLGHVARLDDITPANMALQLHINVSLNRPPDRTWRRPPGRPRKSWLDQLRNDSTRPTGELWRRAVDRGHGGATTRRTSPATWPWRWWWWRWLSISCPVSCDWSVKCQHVGPCSRVLVTHYPRSLAVNADSVLYRDPQLKSWPALRRMHLSIHLHRTSWYVCMSVCLSVRLCLYV